MPPEKTSHETPAPPAQPEEQHDKERNSWLRQRSVWAGIGVILLLLVVGIILTNNRRTGVSPEQIALTPITSNADWTPVERDFDGITMVLVPAGCFMMGSDDGDDDEKPIHEQCFNEPFWINKYEVTNAQYGSVRCEQWSSDPDQPRNCVSWFDAQDFCEARGGRLPTEAEWEYAARGPDSLVYPWGNDFIAENVVYYDNADRTAAVGSRSGGVSWVGALDMSGNVWEWVSSLYQDYPYDAKDGRERDTGSSTDVNRVLRGGVWNTSESYFLRAASRDAIYPSYILNNGFRCARDVDG